MKRFITYLLLTLFAGGCIKNDIPLPVVVPRITAMDVEGATAVNIDSEKRKVIITLDETTDIRQVNIRSITFADEATSTSWDITGAQDLSKPIAITLTIYQDYVWTVTAEQPIERYFTVNGQVGSSEIVSGRVSGRLVLLVREPGLVCLLHLLQPRIVQVDDVEQAEVDSVGDFGRHRDGIVIHGIVEILVPCLVISEFLFVDTSRKGYHKRG